MNRKRGFTFAIIGIGLIASSLTSASAATWRQTHPRRAEVNHRLATQNARIDRDVSQGKITSQQAAQLHSEDAGVRSQERFDASLDNGHVTKPEQRSLNQNENAISRQIYQDAH